MLRASVWSTPVRFQRGKISTGRWPASGHTLNTRVQGELTGVSGHPVEAHNGSFFSPCYKYFLHSCVGALLLISTAEKHPWECQEEQGPSEVIEIWESQREPSLVRSRVAKCASTLLIRFVMVKWESMLVTLGDRYHLDGLVVIGSLVIIRRACGWLNSSCERLWVIHHDGVSKNQPVESTWSLRGLRGATPLRGCSNEN
jgi:hypothetical protein